MEDLKNLKEEFKKIIYEIVICRIKNKGYIDPELITKKNQLKKEIIRVKISELEKGKEDNNDKCKGR